MKNFTLEKIRSIFTTKNASKEEKKPLKIHAMQLKFFLLHAALKHIQKGNSKKPLSLFTMKILSSKSEHFAALIRQAEKACSKQDIELFSYKEFFCRYQFALRRAVQWKMSKYIKTQEEAKALIQKMKECSPDAFKRHLVTLLKEEGVSSEDIAKEAQRLAQDWQVYQKGQGASAPTTRINPL